jgi:hypothetical protein
MNKQEHQHLFYGTGTVNPWSEAALSAPIGPLSIQLWGAALIPLYRGEYDYKGSTILMGSLGVQYAFADAFSFAINQEVYHETHASWGETQANNSGRTDLLASLSLSWTIASDLEVHFGVRKPYATISDGHQLVIPIAGNLNVLYGL